MARAPRSLGEALSGPLQQFGRDYQGQRQLDQQNALRMFLANRQQGNVDRQFQQSQSQFGVQQENVAANQLFRQEQATANQDWRNRQEITNALQGAETNIFRDKQLKSIDDLRKAQIGLTNKKATTAGDLKPPTRSDIDREGRRLKEAQRNRTTSELYNYIAGSNPEAWAKILKDGKKPKTGSGFEQFFRQHKDDFGDERDVPVAWWPDDTERVLPANIKALIDNLLQMEGQTPAQYYNSQQPGAPVQPAPAPDLYGGYGDLGAYQEAARKQLELNQNR